VSQVDDIDDVAQLVGLVADSAALRGDVAPAPAEAYTRVIVGNTPSAVPRIVVVEVMMRLCPSVNTSNTVLTTMASRGSPTENSATS